VIALRSAGLFGGGVLSLEFAGSLFHAHVVRDAPLSLEKMLRADILIAVLSAGAVLAWQALLRGAQGGRSVLSWCLGFVFGLFLELLNDAFPGGLFSPRNVGHGIVVWSYVLVGTLGAAAVLSRPHARANR
jgi:hypothetical protein